MEAVSELTSVMDKPDASVEELEEAAAAVDALEAKLIAEAEKLKIVNIAGHSTNPGIRVSMYNAMPVAGVVSLCHFLEKFKRENPIDASMQAKL